MARILLAEPDRRIRQFFAGILADCGHAVEACSSAAEATTSLAARRVDIVITDMVLDPDPAIDLGLKCAHLGIPTVTLSGGKFRPQQSAAERPPALVEKPFRFGDLQTVLKVVAGEAETV
jgi:DNA-binding NtrC family response regulator